MSLYKVGIETDIVRVIGPYVGQLGTDEDAMRRAMEAATPSSKPEPKKSSAAVWVVLGLMGLAYVAIPGKKGWQRALGSGQ